MKFEPLSIPGALRIVPTRIGDDRGWFARTYCRDELSRQGIPVDFVQRSVSHNKAAGTLRGLHFQQPPFSETKLVRCTRGAVFDVLVDLRLGSPMFGEWYAEVLSPDDGAMLLIPPGCAHGFLTLQDNTDVYYEISPAYEPSAARGVRYDDPAIGISWPAAAKVVSDRDANLPRLADLPPTSLIAVQSH